MLLLHEGRKFEGLAEETMTPQERKLIDELFERLASLERNPRDPEAVRAINAFATGGSFPDRTLVLMLDEGHERALARDEVSDRIGGRPRDYHHKVALAFQLIAAEEPDRVRLIDASGAPEAVTQRLLDAIADLLA